MRFTPLALLAALVIAGCGDGEASIVTDPPDICGDVKPAIEPIYDGVDHPTAVSLTNPQIRSVGALNIDYSGSCTATLIAPTVVLTASHCVESLGWGSTLHFIVGENYMSPDRMIEATSWYTHPLFPGSSGGSVDPTYDIAVIILSEDATAYGLEPIPAHLDTRSIIGETIQAVGFGMTSPSGGWNSRRWWTTMPVAFEQPAVRYVDGEGVTGICSGDSGGPMLWNVPGEGVRVMGVVSGGEAGCTGLTGYPRTDFHSDFLSEYVGTTDPCGGETWQGRCDGDTAVWCEDDLVYTHACADFGWICGTDGDGNRRCIEPPDPCDGETWQGRCDGDTAVWCEDDLVYTHACADFGWFCGIDADGNSRCVNDPCRGETWQGRCEGDTAVWCEDEAVLTHACADFGWLCGTDADGNSRCIPPPEVDPCDALGHAGECVEIDGEWHARWCQGGEIRDRNCTVCEQVCDWAGDALGWYCI